MGGGKLYSWTMREYLDFDAVSSSNLRDIALKSPLDYKHGDKDETDGMRLGTATHCLTLEPHRFSDTHAVWNVKNSSGDLLARNPRFKKWQEFEHANHGKNIITPDQHKDARDQADTIRKEPQAAQLITLSGGVAEASIVVNMGHDVLVKIRPDWMTNGTLVHLKGVHTTNPRKLWNNAYDMGWHITFALYHDAAYMFDKKNRESWVVVCRNSRPYYAKALIVPDDFLECGRDEYTESMEKLLECRRTGEWPGDLHEHTCIELPPWVKRRRQMEELLA